MFDVTLATLGLVATSPLQLVLLALAAWSTGSSGLFRQIRVGHHGKPFVLLKLRSMRPSNPGPPVTAQGDPRITPFGSWLRARKLDELPQLWNVLRGDMALVGPRPEVLDFVDLDDPRWQLVLSVRPGLTDPVTAHLRHEEEVLGATRKPLDFYREVLLPWKLDASASYLGTRTWLSDLAVLMSTFRGLFFERRPATLPSRVRRPES